MAMFPVCLALKKAPQCGAKKEPLKTTDRLLNWRSGQLRDHRSADEPSIGKRGDEELTTYAKGLA